MRLERAELFTLKRDYLFFAFLISALFLTSLGVEYYGYKQLSRFDTAEEKVLVLNQYVKQKNGRSYSVLKLRLQSGKTFYTTASPLLRNLIGRSVRYRFFTDKITFYDYMKGFFAFGKITAIDPSLQLRERINQAVGMQHESRDAAEIFGALFTAAPLGKELRGSISALGVSHLLAISGFHLGVLSILLFALLSRPYRYAQARYFPYRSRQRDLFFIVAFTAGLYLLLLGWVPSLIRAYAMMVAGFILYDRGIKIVSFQTLFVTVALMLACFPSLGLYIGFWLSVAGVFYIFLFLHHFSAMKAYMQFLLLNGWVYLMMLPLALFLFGTFSLYHPLSVVWTMLFTLFYPLALALHAVGLGGWLDGVLLWVVKLPAQPAEVAIAPELLCGYLLLSLAAMKNRIALGTLVLAALAVFIKAVYEVA